ncbi:MAG: hypothetical protein ABWY79_09375 [Solirubrobacterales bacterium]
MIVAIVALVIAIGAKNAADDNEASSSETAQALEQQLTDKADKLSAELAKDVKQTSSVGQSAKKAEDRSDDRGPAGKAEGEEEQVGGVQEPDA